jgi:hypothetical protein
MEAQATAGLLRFFQGIQDPRARNCSHYLSDVLSIAIMAVLCGSEGWAAVESWGLLNRDWLATFLDLPHGIGPRVPRVLNACRRRKVDHSC